MYPKGEFHEAQSAARAIEELKAHGLDVDDIEVFSAEPVLFAPGVLDRPSRMSLAVVIGAVILAVAATWFVFYAQHDYPLVTGGMPLFSFWATGIISYEMTMLGAIITTFGCFLWESGLLRRNGKGPVPAVDPGSICLRVHCDAGRLAEITECLRRAGASNVETLEERS